ncbi:hypothetical protein ACJMK2_018323 [Sinanodonta woodiana]|uniref:Uncharacterized protein n=1 Tax=Sinanodonta woodiana TaxID=1069815 RepID=A0ABD3UEN5_SINWO
MQYMIKQSVQLLNSLNLACKSVCWTTPNHGRHWYADLHDWHYYTKDKRLTGSNYITRVRQTNMLYNGEMSFFHLPHDYDLIHIHCSTILLSVNSTG